MRGSSFSRLAILGGLILAAAGSLTSCGAGGENSSAPIDDNGDFAVTMVLRASNGSVRTSFAVGESVEFELTVTNRTGATRVLTLPTAQVYDLAVLADGSQS